MKINKKKVNGKEFAFDGCHKIYILEKPADKIDCLEAGYKQPDIFPIWKLPEIYDNSCPMRFIYSWSLKTVYAKQGKKAKFEVENESE